MSGNVRRTAAAAEEKVEEALDTVVDDTVATVTVSKEWLEDLEERLAKAERPVLVKAKDAVLNNRRRIVLGATTVAVLGAAAYVATHKDTLLEGVENTAEATEHGVADVKKTARKARTGSTTK